MPSKLDGSELESSRAVAEARSPKPEASYLRAPAVSFLLLAVGGGGSAENAEDFVFFHDDEVFAIDLDFGTGILAEQDAVVLMNGEREGLAFIVGAAFAGGNHDAPLAAVFLRCRGMMIPPRVRGSFLHATYQDAVMQWAKFRHGWLLLSKVEG